MDIKSSELSTNPSEGFIRLKQAKVSDMGVSDFGTFDDDMEDSIIEPVFDPYDTESVMRRLLWAAQNDRLDVLEDILEDPKQDAGLLTLARDEDGYTPLHRACYNGHDRVVKYLISKGADIRAKTNDGWEPIHCASFWSNHECLSTLLNSFDGGCGPTAPDYQNGQLPSCHIVNALTRGGLTPLHLACQNNGSRETLEILLFHPFLDPLIKTPMGDTAKDIAMRKSAYAYLFEILEPSINSLNVLPDQNS